MKKGIILFSAILISAYGFSQTTEASTAEKETRKVEHIMESLDVDEGTASKLSTLLDEFKAERKAVFEDKKTEKAEMKEKMESMSDDEIEKIHREKFNDQRAMVDMEEQYYNRFLEIAPASKVETLLREERKHMRKRMHASKGQGSQKHERKRQD